MQLSSAHLYYGTSRYPINNLTVKEVPFAPLAGRLLEQVAQEVAIASGCLSTQNVIDRITHNVAVAEQVFVYEGGSVTIPAHVALIGNGFGIQWR